MSPSLQTSGSFPQVKVSAAGFATAIWFDYDGLWLADRPASAVWSAPKLLVPGLSSVIFVTNKSGDEAIVWGTGGARAKASAIVVMRRSAGQLWGSQQTAVTGTHLGPNGVALSDNGDLVVAWESFDALCTRRCRLSNFVLHVTREGKAESTWHDSGVLAGPDLRSHGPFIAIDSHGTVGVLFTTAAGPLVSMVQAGAGQPWSSQSPVYSVAGSFVTGFTTDANGNAIVVLLGTQVIAIGGQLATNTWSNAAVISGNDQAIQQVIFAEGPNGAAVALWAAGTNFSDNTIRATTRSAATANWTAPVTLSPSGVQLAAPEVVDVNASGEALVILSAFDSSFLHHTEYSNSYQPARISPEAANPSLAP